MAGDLASRAFSPSRENCDTFSCKPTSGVAPAREPPDVTCLHGLLQGHPKGVRSVAPVFLAIAQFPGRPIARKLEGGVT
jgi:hypothetical protein